MKTILLPVDFSAASINAARYAAELSALPEYQIGRIILLNSYFVSNYEQILPTPDFVVVGGQEIREKRGGLRQRLGAFREAMLPFVGQAVAVECMESEEPLLRSILNAIAAQKPDVLFIGSSSDDLSEIGEHLIGIARISPVPVLIVPGGKPFEPIHKVLLPCDFRDLACLSPLKIMQESEFWRDKKVLVVNTDRGKRSSEPDDRYRAVSASLEKYLAGIEHEIRCSEESDTLLGILHIAQAEKVDIIVSLPGKRSFFYSLTHRNISQALVRNAEIPVLILK
jgi:nucleotide-binding universal stress UspA family protein